MDQKSSFNIDVFRLAFTPSEFNLFNWDTLKIETTTYINKEQREKRTDVVFSVQLKRSKQAVKIILLLEHKSYEYPNLLKQLLHYQACIYERQPHPVIPVLLYHGKPRRWKSPLSFHESLKGLTPLVQKHFGENILDFKVRMLNLRDLKIVSKIERSKLTSSPILYILATIWEANQKELEALIKLGKKLKDNTGKSEVREAIDYLIQNNPKITWKDVIKTEEQLIKQEDKRIMATWKSSFELAVEKGEKKGEKKGKKEGKEEIAINLMRKGMDDDFIMECTRLTANELEALKERAEVA